MLSILIPTYNYDCYFLVKELKQQADATQIEYEILVLDDFSSSLSNENSKINLLENCKLLQNTENLGRTKTRQKLSNSAKFDWLLLLDSDVFPTDSNFIKKYIDQLNEEISVVVGGIKYKKKIVSKSQILRYKYGINREESALKERQNKPYNHILSANILIKKSVFDKYNYSKKNNLYGLDIYFAFQLFFNKISILHIENGVFHNGIETNHAFFTKSLNAVITRKIILEKHPQIVEINSLCKHYLFLKKYKLTFVFSSFFILFKPVLKKIILNSNPSLLCFDIYRLGYMCSLK